LAAIFEMPLVLGSYITQGHGRTAHISLNGETSNFPKLFAKLAIQFHIWN